LFKLRDKLSWKLPQFSKIKNIVATGISTYNPYSSSLYRVETVDGEKVFQPIIGGVKKHNKHYKVLSFLSNSDFVFDTLEINKNIPDDEVKDAIYNIVYEELDNSIEYHIMFDEIKKRDEEKKSEYLEFNIFIIDPNIAKYLSSTISRSIKYIDRIYPIPILFKSLYKFSGEYDRTECFVYIYRDGTSFNLFVKGELLYSKALSFSTLVFFEYFREYIEDRKIFYPEFQKIVTDENRLLENVKYRRALTKSLKHLFEEISDVINYIKRNFNIEEIDNIYYSSKLGRILGIAEYSETLVGEHSFNGFLSEFSITFPDDIDEIHYLLYLTYQLNQDNRNIYLDILKPPPSFFVRPVGKLTLVTVGAIALSLVYPLYNYYQTYRLQEEIIVKKELEKRLKKRYLERKAILESISKEKNRLISTRDNYKKRLDKKIALLNAVYTKKKNYTMKGEEIKEITYKLNSYNVAISHLQYENGEFFLTLVSNDANNITSLLKNLINDYMIYSDIIELDNPSQLYHSNLKIIDKFGLVKE